MNHYPRKWIIQPSSCVGNIIARDGGMNVDKFLKIIRALDCEVIIHSKFDEDKDMEWKL